ncbi:hypothetical protein RRG08_017921 [Elysia crispata]|uniref:Uncharacterized protein n=1 Tax=Elysia crispata TaxID=231223 RepID=A0AAE0XZH4_9GAST|nr:hypothetical protein RRG08_017921 [Elysia crispata]
MLYDRRIFDGRFKVDNLFRNWCKITKVPPRALQLSGQLVSTTSDRDAGLHRATLKKSKTEHSGKQRKKMTMKLLAVFLLVTVVSVTADPDDDCCQEIPAPASGGPDVECDFTPTCRLKGNCCPDTGEPCPELPI